MGIFGWEIRNLGHMDFCVLEVGFVGWLVGCCGFKLLFGVGRGWR